MSDNTYSRSLLYLLKHQELAELFVDRGGADQLISVLNGEFHNAQIAYSSVLNIFLLSFVPRFMGEWLCNPKQGVLRRIIELLSSTYREKVIRASFRLFGRVARESQRGTDLLIDLNLDGTIEGILKGTAKDEETLRIVGDVRETLSANRRELKYAGTYSARSSDTCTKWRGSCWSGVRCTRPTSSRSMLCASSQTTLRSSSRR